VTWSLSDAAEKCGRNLERNCADKIFKVFGKAQGIGERSRFGKAVELPIQRRWPSPTTMAGVAVWEGDGSPLMYEHTLSVPR
jgi:hypothetical protein